MSNDKSPTPRIVKYQTKASEYKYTAFWQGRAYDQRAERLLLRQYFKYFKDLPKTAWLTDIGGNFGRLLPVYATRFRQVAILDYASHEFHVAQQTADQLQLQLHLVRANAYQLPLMDGSQPYLISVRVIHHLENPALFFKEVKRVLRPGGIFIFQASNKNNLKTFFKCLFTNHWANWRANYLDIGSSGTQADGTFVLIRNYKAAYLEALMQQYGFQILAKRSISWLRSWSWVRRWPALSYPLEWMLQIVSVICPLGPSNWYVLRQPVSDQIGRRYVNFLPTLRLPHNQQRLTAQLRPKFLKQTPAGAKYYDLLAGD